MNYKIIALIVLSVCILDSNASTCNFDFTVPGVGSSCIMKGGLPETLIDKYNQLFGGVEGLKLIVDDKNGLRKLVEDQLSRLQREQQIYSQNINQITQDIQNVKRILGIFPIPADHSRKSKVDKRAVDPLQSLKVALHEAEMKLANMTRNMEENARRRSMTFSSLEQLVLQQDQRLSTTLQNIANLEKKAGQLPGVNIQQTTSGVSSLSLKAAMDIATISSKIQATSQIIQARVQDINERLLEMDKPIQERYNSYQVLDNNLIRLQAGVSSIVNDTATLKQSFVKTKSDFTQRLTSVESDLKQRSQSYQMLENNFRGNKTKVDQFVNQMKQEKQTVQNATTTIAQLTASLPQIQADLKNITDEATVIKKDPYYHLAQYLHTLSTTTTTFTKDAAKEVRYIKQLKLMLLRLEMKVNSTQAG